LDSLRLFYFLEQTMSKTTILEYTIGEFRGNFPDVPTAAGVDMDALRADDPDPLFVTLPVVPQIGMTSRNGLLYDETLTNSIVQQINAKRPEAIFGHLKDEERSTSYPEPAAHWIGATVADGKAWAKAYVPPGPSRDRVKRLKATGGQIATSIYGKGAYEATATKGVRRLADFDLESLDFAPPARAALQNGAYPIITAELAQEDNPDMNRDELIAELNAGDIPQELRDAIIAEHGQRNSQATTIAELQQQVSDRDTLVTELQTTVAEFQRTAFETALDGRIAELTNWPVKGDDATKKLAAFRRTLRARVIAELGDDRGEEAVTETVTEVWGDLEPLAETLRDSLAGPAAVIRSKVTGKRRELDESAQAVESARGQWGI